MTILNTTQVCIIGFAAIMGWLLAGRLKRARMTDDERAQAFSSFFFNFIGALMTAAFITATSGQFMWGLFIAPFVMCVPQLKELLFAHGKFIWPRISTGRMFAFVTLITVLIGFQASLWRWHQSSMAKSEEQRQARNHAAQVEAYRRNRDAIEAKRDKLSPEYYDRTSRELDAQAALLGVE